MNRKAFLLLPALALLVLANLSLSCKLSVSGEEVGGYYSPKALRRAELTARCAAEEIARYEAQLPEPDKKRDTEIQRDIS